MVNASDIHQKNAESRLKIVAKLLSFTISRTGSMAMYSTEKNRMSSRPNLTALCFPRTSSVIPRTKMTLTTVSIIRRLDTCSQSVKFSIW